jgi:hypothetical protein
MALASHVPATWDTILSTTMHNYRKTLTDNIFGSRGARLPGVQGWVRSMAAPIVEPAARCREANLRALE